MLEIEDLKGHREIKDQQDLRGFKDLKGLWVL